MRTGTSGFALAAAIVVVTGYEEPFISRARTAGADVVLTKPIAWSALIDRLVPATPLAA